MSLDARPKSAALGVICAAAVLAATLSACGSGSGAPAVTTTSQAGAHGPLFKLNRALRIGVKTDQPGIGLADSTGGNNTGLDIEIARELAAALNDQPVFQSVVSQNREDMLTSGAVDLVIASYSITDARLEKVDFAGPYLIAGQDILVRNADAAAYSGVDSLRDKKVCTLAASTGYRHLQDHFSEAWVREHIATLTPEGKPILGYQTCVDLLVNGTVDAVSTDDAALAGYANLKQYQGLLHLVGNRFSREKYGIGLAKGDPADKALINASLAQMIQDGRWANSIRKNLGVSADIFLRPDNRPAPPTN
jgi:glutamate transport system substrate-binding protein